MHQPIVRLTRSLAPPRHHRPHRRRRPLPLLRRLPPQCPPTSKPALPHAPPRAHPAPPPPPPPPPPLAAEVGRAAPRPGNLSGTFPPHPASIFTATRQSPLVPACRVPRCSMTGIPSRPSWPKRILLTVAALVAFLLLFVIALR